MKFNCYDCGQPVEAECSEEEIRQQSIRDYGRDLLDSDEPHALVCDECYCKNIFKDPVIGSLN